MDSNSTFDDRLAARFHDLSPAEQRTARFFRDNRAQVLVSSALELASNARTSDATIVRTTRRLGFAGLDDLRRHLAAEMRNHPSPADRLAKTLGEVGDDLQAAFKVTLDIHVEGLTSLRSEISPASFRTAVTRIVAAKRILIFGIGPSSALAEYFVFQLGRFGLESTSLTHTGLLFADDLRKLKGSDLVIVLAYGKVYRELAILIDTAKRWRVGVILLTDTLADTLRNRVDLVLPVARGRATMLSMHTATLGLIETLLVGVATQRPRETLAGLAALNDARAMLAIEPAKVPAKKKHR